MALSEARRMANEKYIKEKCDEIKIRVPKGKKSIIKEFAESKGKSVNGFVNEAVDEKMEREGE